MVDLEEIKNSYKVGLGTETTKSIEFSRYNITWKDFKSIKAKCAKAKRAKAIEGFDFILDEVSNDNLNVTVNLWYN